MPVVRDEIENNIKHVKKAQLFSPLQRHTQFTLQKLRLTTITGVYHSDRNNVNTPTAWNTPIDTVTLGSMIKAQ